MQAQIPTHKVEKLVAKLVKLNKKADKYGTGHIKYELGEAFYSDITYTVRLDRGLFEERKRTVSYTPVIFDFDNVVKLNGYTICAMLEKLDSDNNFVSVFAHNDELNVTELRNLSNFYCEHCHTSRVQKYLAIVRNDETGKFLQVGKSCLQDFIGHDINVIIQMMDYPTFINSEFNDEDEDKGHWPAYINPMKVVTCTMLAMQMVGHAYTDELRSAISQMYFNPLGKIEDNEDIVNVYNNFMKYCDTLSDSTNGFLSNLYTVMHSKYTPEKFINVMIAGFVNWFNRDKQKRENESANGANEFFGTVGKREKFSLTAHKIHFYESNYGNGYIVKGVQTGTNNSFTWFTSNPKEFVQWTTHGDYEVISEPFEVTASVKEHKTDDKFGNSTILTRINF
jgi:hypothetical protein